MWPTREEAERVALRAGAYGDRVVTVDQYTEPVPDTIATYRIGGDSMTKTRTMYRLRYAFKDGREAFSPGTYDTREDADRAAVAAYLLQFSPYFAARNIYVERSAQWVTEGIATHSGVERPAKGGSK